MTTEYTYYDSEHTKVKTEAHRIGNIFHREGDKPAYIEYYENGNMRHEEYRIYGNNSREGDKPAVVNYYKNGNVRFEEYRINGKYYREGDNPNKIEYSEDGNIIIEIWMSSEDRNIEVKRNVIDMSLELTKCCRD